MDHFLATSLERLLQRSERERGFDWMGKYLEEVGRMEEGSIFEEVKFRKKRLKNELEKENREWSIDFYCAVQLFLQLE